MSTAAMRTSAAAPKATSLLATGLRLQRQCACGAKLGASDEACEGCRGAGLQKKLALGAADDPLERDADRVATEVLQRPVRAGATPPRVQRLPSSAQGGEVPAAVIAVLASAGEPLAEGVRGDMEQRFGHDFSRVRVHFDGAAHRSAREVSAHAYTAGAHIVFAAGQYAPERAAGRSLLAHELAHVLQQPGHGSNGAAPRAGRSVDAVPIQRMPVTATANERPASIESRLLVLEKKQAATSLDLRWRAQFGARMASYRQAVLRISGGFDTASREFDNAQGAQARADALMTQLSAAVLAVIFALGFEWTFASALGGLGRSAEAIQKSVELVENPANAAVSGGVNVAGLMTAAESARSGATPAIAPIGGAASEGAFAFLTSNLEELERHTQLIEQAFIERDKAMERYTDLQWQQFEPAAQESVYQQLLNDLDAVAKGVEAMKPADQVARVLERHLWAAWILREVKEVIPDCPTGDTEDFACNPPHEYFSVGTEVAARLTQIGVPELAGVELPFYWYSTGSTGWGPKLLQWANGYHESVAT